MENEREKHTHSVPRLKMLHYSISIGHLHNEGKESIHYSRATANLLVFHSKIFFLIFDETFSLRRKLSRNGLRFFSDRRPVKDMAENMYI